MWIFAHFLPPKISLICNKSYSRFEKEIFERIFSFASIEATIKFGWLNANIMCFITLIRNVFGRSHMSTINKFCLPRVKSQHTIYTHGTKQNKNRKKKNERKKIICCLLSFYRLCILFILI